MASPGGDNDLPRLISQAVAETLVTGDGAFKISLDPDISDGPILEFWGADRVEYVYRHGRVCEVHFLSPVGDKGRLLKEIYSPGGVRYELLDGDKAVPLAARARCCRSQACDICGRLYLGCAAAVLAFQPMAGARAIHL